MQNQHVTPFPSNGGEHSLYTGVPQEAGASAYPPIDPSLDDTWTPQQADSHQYAHQRFPITPQYYQHSYVQQQPQQQPIFQGYSGMAQPASYAPYQQPQANHFSDAFFSGPSTQHAFANGYDFPAQPAQHETISPQALQVEDSMPQSHFHQRELSQQQVFKRNAQHDAWPQEQPVVNSSAHFPNLLNGNAVPKSASNIISAQQSNRGNLDYSSYMNSVANRAPAASSYEYDSRTGQSLRGSDVPSVRGGGAEIGQSLTAPPKNQNIPAPRPNPPRITDQNLLDQHPSEKDVTHRVEKLPFAVLGESVTQLDIRGKTTIPKYHARANSIGKNFTPRNDLFATRSVAPTPRKRGRPRKEDSIAKSKTVSSKSAISKAMKVRGSSSQISGKIGSPATPSLESSSADSSSAEEEDESEEEEEMKAWVRLADVRAAIRPTDDPAAAAKYDAVSIVFKEGVQNGQITREEVIKAVQAYEPLVLKLRDNYRSSVAALQEATSQKRQVQIPRLTQAKVINYQALTNALSETLKHGHNDIIKNLGTNHKTAVVLWTILTDFVKVDDFTSELPLIVLELMARFTGLTTDLLKKLKFESIQKRVVKKGTDKMKELLAVISKNTTEEGKRENEASTDSGQLQKAIVQPGKEGAALNTAPRIAGIKRPHDGEDTNGNPSKKVASSATGALNLKGTTTTKTAPRPNVFANLTRPAKLPQASNGSNKAAAKTAPTKPIAKPAPPMTSRFGDILASINAPKEVPKAPVVPEGPPETAEEKKKRERKESRRHLRVTWKEGDELTQIKIFTQVEGEDESRKSELVRDAHDDRSEGMMHKQRAQEEVDIDEEEASGEIEYRPYPDLRAVDFSAIDEQQRSKSYVTRGGQQTFSTSQQQIQNLHESTELMVVYTDPSDIPPSAKEPPASDEADQSGEEKLLGQPTDQWLHQRMQEVQQYGVRRALELAVSRNNHQHVFRVAQSNVNKPQQQIHHTSQAGNQAQITPNVSFNVTPEQAAEAEALIARITAMIAPIIGKSFPATEPPYHTNERQKAEWWEGYNRDKALRSAPEQSYHTLVQQPQIPQPAMQHPQMQSYQQPVMSTPQMSAPQTQAPAFDLQNIMRQVNLATPPNSSQPPQQSTMPPAQMPVPGYDLQSFMQNFNTSNAASQAPLQSWSSYNANSQNMPYNVQAASNMWNDGASENGFANVQASQNWMQNWAGGDNKTQWGNESNGQNNNNKQNRYRDRDDTRGVRDRDEPIGGRAENRKVKGYKVGTKPCRFFLEDKCAKGDKCTYLHER